MTKQIIDKQTASHYTWGNNCDSWVLADSEGLSVKQESMPPNTQEQLHFHTKAQQFFFVLKGSATFYLNNEQIILNEQQGLSVTPNSKHFIANESNDTLEVLVISQPSTVGDRVDVE